MNIFDSRTHQITPAGNQSTIPATRNDDIIAITFRAEWDEQEESSVMLEDTLTVDATMEEILEVGDIISDLEADGTALDYKYLIQKRGGRELTLKWGKFKDLSIKKMMRIKNIDEDYIVIMRK